MEFDYAGETHRFDSSRKLTVENLQLLKDYFVESRSTNNTLNAKLHRKAWDMFKDQRANGLHPAFEGKRDGISQTKVKEILNELKVKNASKYANSPTAENQVSVSSSITFILKGDGEISFVPAKGTFGGGTMLQSSGVVLPRIQMFTEGNQSSMRFLGNMRKVFFFGKRAKRENPCEFLFAW